MKRSISAIIAITGLYAFPNLLGNALLEQQEMSFGLYVVYIGSILALVYWVHKTTEDEMLKHYKRAEKLSAREVFHERMKGL